MRAPIFALTAVFLWAVGNFFIESKFAKVSPLVNMLFFYGGVVICSGLMILFREQIGIELAFPKSSLWPLVVLMGIMLFFADFSYFSAYSAGGSLVVVTTMIIMLPVFASVIKFAAGGGLPTALQALGWAFAAAGVVLVVIGGKT